ncbi:MAG: YihY/virulence factor BrkB family protein [Gloeobacteraceae cyanobacterium ES-bin-144]|nr:YihY/virulence factor BrkB family protein [Verrucomicrobiales bacterium]
MIGSVNLPLLRTLRFARRVLRDFFFRNNGLILTGAVAYSAMLSLVPLATVLVVFFSHFLEEKLLMDALTTEVAMISPKATPMLVGVLKTFMESRETAGWIGIAGLLFFSSVAFRVLANAFAIIFHRKLPARKRSFWIAALIPYLFIALVAVGLIVLTAVTAVIESTAGRTYALGGFDFGMQWIAAAGLNVAGFLGLVILFTTLYKVMPVTKVSVRLALSGGVTAAVMWEILRSGLVNYFTHLSPVNAVYGSMATTIILLLTLEAAALIVLLGAQVIADLQRSIHAGRPWYEDLDELEKD